IDFTGTLLLVTHDRAFLDNVVTSTLAFEDEGRIGEYVGGYTDWLQQRRAPSPEHPAPARDKPAQVRTEPAAKQQGKLSYKLQRELDSLPGKIEALEAEQSRLTALVNDPGFYARPREEIAATLAELETLSQALEASYARWAELEG
ncbi:MAG TPA: ABC transporter ATP-binding protein, partial [Steroidobacteraceae bacterium]|nr:ABC transporter ATP-binding protein [Steroidobacteraceae bacterium]